MSKAIEGTFTLNEILNSTYHSRYENRFEYAERDVLKTIIQIKETTLHPDSKMAPSITFVFKSFSYPQYRPYNSYTKYSKQRKFKHTYDQVLSIAADENGTFSLNSRFWKYRLGSQKKWVDHPPQSKVKTIYRETAEKWKLEYDKEVEKLHKRFKGKDLEKQLKLAKTRYNQKKIEHRKSAKYLDTGDYNSQVNGINGDFAMRCQSTYQYFGHLFGRNTYPEGEVDQIYIFTPKHFIRLISALMKIGVLHE